MCFALYALIVSSHIEAVLQIPLDVQKDQVIKSPCDKVAATFKWFLQRGITRRTQLMGFASHGLRVLEQVGPDCNTTSVSNGQKRQKTSQREQYLQDSGTTCIGCAAWE